MTNNQLLAINWWMTSVLDETDLLRPMKTELYRSWSTELHTANAATKFIYEHFLMRGSSRLRAPSNRADWMMAEVGYPLWILLKNQNPDAYRRDAGLYLDVAIPAVKKYTSQGNDFYAVMLLLEMSFPGSAEPISQWYTCDHTYDLAKMGELLGYGVPATEVKEVLAKDIDSELLRDLFLVGAR
jgi:hypothetical protein